MNQETKQLNVLQRLIGVLINPRVTFEEINQKPTLWLPLTIILLLNVAITATMLPKTIDYALELVKKTPNFPAGMENIVRMQAIIGGILGALLGPVIIWLVTAGLIKLFTVFFGNDGNFKNIFVVNIFAYLPTLIGALVKSVIFVFIKTNNINAVQTSLALLLPEPSNPAKPGFLYALFSHFDFFTLWSLVLVTIGTVVVFKISNKKSAAIVFGIFIFFALLISTLTGLLSKLPTTT